METNWRMQLMNELMELIFMTGSSMGLSEKQRARLTSLYQALTDSGREHIDIWAEEQSRGDFTKHLIKDPFKVAEILELN